MSCESNLIVCTLRGASLLPIVDGSMIRRCHACGAEVWISPASLRRAEVTGCEPICIPCYLKLPEAASYEVQPFTGEQLAEAAGTLKGGSRN